MQAMNKKKKKKNQVSFYSLPTSSPAFFLTFFHSLSHFSFLFLVSLSRFSLALLSFFFFSFFIPIYFLTSTPFLLSQTLILFSSHVFFCSALSVTRFPSSCVHSKNYAHTHTLSTTTCGNNTRHEFRMNTAKEKTQSDNRGNVIVKFPVI